MWYTYSSLTHTTPESDHDADKRPCFVRSFRIGVMLVFGTAQPTMTSAPFAVPVILHTVEFCKGARQSDFVSVWQHTLVG